MRATRRSPARGWNWNSESGCASSEKRTKRVTCMLVTGCYGSLTSFNLLFAVSDDQFRGAAGGDQD